MRQRGVSSERRRSSCSSFISYIFRIKTTLLMAYGVSKRPKMSNLHLIMNLIFATKYFLKDISTSYWWFCFLRDSYSLHLKGSVAWGVARFAGLNMHRICMMFNPPGLDLPGCKLKAFICYSVNGTEGTSDCMLLQIIKFFLYVEGTSGWFQYKVTVLPVFRD